MNSHFEKGARGGEVMRQQLQQLQPNLIGTLEADDPACPPELLEFYSHQTTLAPLVAANPNTPKEVMWRLAYRHPLDVLANPILPLLLLEDSGLADRLDIVLIEILTRFPPCPQPFLARFHRMTREDFYSLLYMWRQENEKDQPKRTSFLYGEVAMYWHLQSCLDENSDLMEDPGLPEDWKAFVRIAASEGAITVLGVQKSRGYRMGMRHAIKRIHEVLDRLKGKAYDH